MPDISAAQTESQEEGTPIAAWSDSFATGIELIDDQHKNLIAMTNQLFQACRRGGDTKETVFKEVLSRMVEYVRVHFTTEQNLFHRVSYPAFADHKKEHDGFVKKVLESSKEFGEGKTNTVNEFVKFLKDWIMYHIAHSDKMYAIYISDQKKKGLLTDKDITG